MRSIGIDPVDSLYVAPLSAEHIDDVTCSNAVAVVGTYIEPGCECRILVLSLTIMR